MKKLKTLGVLLLLAVCTLVFGVTAFADNRAKAQDESYGVWLDDRNGLYLCFEEDEEAKGIYCMEMLKNGKVVHHYQNSGKNPISGGRIALWAILDLRMNGLESGDYTFRVKGMKDGETALDKKWLESDPQNPFHYSKPTQAFGKPQNLQWSDLNSNSDNAGIASYAEDLDTNEEYDEFYDEDAEIYDEDWGFYDEDSELYSGEWALSENNNYKKIATWDPPANMANIPEESKKGMRYFVRLYKNGKQVGGVYNLTETAFDMTDWIKEYGEGKYTFSVQIQDRSTTTAQSPVVMSEEYIDVAQIVQAISGKLGDILNKMNSDDAMLASPSNALAAVEKLDIEDTAVAVQVNDSVLSMYQAIEKQYLDSIGVTVEKNVSEDTGFASEDVEVIGAGFNIASPSNAVAIEIKKADTDEATKIDPAVYSYAEVYEISLKNAVGRLRAPVTIIMPIPEGINPDRLRILHYHKNGTSEAIYPMIIGGKAKFTVTEFSRFAFVEQSATGSGDDKPEKDPGTTNRPSGSGGSGGGGGGGSRPGGAASGVVTTDSKKGYINSVTGIIIGTEEGYSQWISEEIPETEGATRWKLQYADGTFALGSYVTDEQGNPVKDAAGNLIEQPLWEMIHGAWYAFGVDGYSKSGLVWDPALMGWFYLDSNTGMKTGWQQIEGKWYYFNSVSDGTKGMMYINRITPDGYQVTEDGSWDGQSGF